MAESRNYNKTSSIQIQIDVAILDYLIYTATHNLIDNAHADLRNDQDSSPPRNEVRKEKSRVLLEMVDCESVCLLGFFWYLSLYIRLLRKSIRYYLIHPC